MKDPHWVTWFFLFPWPSMCEQPHFSWSSWSQSSGRKGDFALSQWDDSEKIMKRCYLLRQRSVQCRRRLWLQDCCEPFLARRSIQRGSSPGATARHRTGSGRLRKTGTRAGMRPLVSFYQVNFIKTRVLPGYFKNVQFYRETGRFEKKKKHLVVPSSRSLYPNPYKIRETLLAKYLEHMINYIDFQLSVAPSIVEMKTVFPSVFVDRIL